MGRSIVCSGESPQCVRRRKPLPPVGSDAPTPARIGTGRPKGRSHFSFGGERKVCKRKPAARRLREKALYCPFWRRGSLCRAQRSWPATPAIVRARSSPFSAVKMGGPFSLRCLSPLCSPAVGGWQAHPLQGGMLRCILGIFAAAMNGLLFLFPDDGRQAHTLHGGLLRRNLGIFATPKASVKSNPRWP